MPQIFAQQLVAMVVLVVSLASYAAAQTVAFVDVNVVPMDRERVSLRQTVIVRDHVITSIGASDAVQAPANAQIVNGNGQLWLSPGLADMHVHGMEPDDLGLYIAQGVTTVLHMGGAPSFFLSHLRLAIASSQVIGPQMFFGMKVDGATDYGIFHVSGVDQARAIVRIARTNGFDFIKVYSKVGAAEFDAIVDECCPEGGRRDAPIGSLRQPNAGDSSGSPHGTIEAGKRADLVLTPANPLDALETLRRPVGVMTHGRWFDASTLGSLVDQRKQRYRRLEELRWTDPQRQGLPK